MCYFFFLKNYVCIEAAIDNKCYPANDDVCVWLIDYEANGSIDSLRIVL